MIESINIKPLVIEVGKRYRMRYGGITGIVKDRPSSLYPFGDGQFCWTEDGLCRHSGINQSDLISEHIEPPAPLPFPLVAGKKFDTVKPDGSAGPVVELLTPNYFAVAFLALAPFECNINGERVCVTPNGDVISDDTGKPMLRIVAEHREPEPSPIERLQSLCNRLCITHGEEIDSIIAALKEQAKCTPST